MKHGNYMYICLLTDVYGMKCTQLRSGLPKIGVQISNPQYHLETPKVKVCKKVGNSNK